MYANILTNCFFRELINWDRKGAFKRIMFLINVYVVFSWIYWWHRFGCSRNMAHLFYQCSWSVWYSYQVTLYLPLKCNDCNDCKQTPTRANRTVAIRNSASPEIIWGLGGPEEDHQLHHCCWTGRVGEREEEEDLPLNATKWYMS